MAQTQRISSNNTVVLNSGDDTIVTLHHTDVVRVNAQRIILNTGGCNTVTTRTRFAQAANQWNLGYTVFQKDFALFVRFQGKTFEWLGDSIVLDRATGKAYTEDGSEIHPN